MLIIPSVFFLSLEGVLRWVGRENCGQRFILERRGDITLEEMLIEGYDIDPDVFWRLTPRVEEVSSQGFRESRIFAIPKPKDVIRILCLGDSVVYGCPESVVKKEQAYPKILERMLNNYFKYINIEVINAGVPGYTSYQGVRYLKKYLLKFNPDIITCHFGIDDAVWTLVEDKNFKCNPSLFRIKLVLTKSYIFRIIERIIVKEKLKNKKLKHRVSPEDYRNNLQEIYNLCSQKGIKVVFLTPVLWGKNKYLELDGYQPPEPVYVVNLYKVFSQNLNGSKYFVDNCHPTPQGQRVIAYALFSKLKTIIENLIPEKN